MKKSKFLLLPLVAVLAACNKGSGNNDIFTQVRNRKVSKETKQGVIDRYDDVEMVTRLDTTIISYSKEDGEWAVDARQDATSYFKTNCSLDEDRIDCSFGYVYNHGSEIESYSEVFAISEEDGKIVFTVGGTDEWYIQKASKLYKRVFNSFFSWNASFFAGATYFLGSDIAQQAYMPQGALNKFAKCFELFEDDGAGSFVINLKEDASYKPSSYMEIYLIEYYEEYEDYLLKHHLSRFSVRIEVQDMKMDTDFTFRTESIKYSNR